MDIVLIVLFFHCKSASLHGCICSGAKAFGSDIFGQGNTTIRSTNYKCLGEEESLVSCAHESGDHYSVDCGHQQDAAVLCVPCFHEGDLSLVNGNEDPEGRVQICHDYHWVAVCVNYWTMPEAVVVCRQLGFPTHGE